MKINWLKLLIVVLVCNAAGFIGAIFTTSNIPIWYATLNKPFFTPPNWLFGPAWTTLYVLMGISLYIVWERTNFNKDGRLGLALFGIQLGLNAIWSILFFGLQNPFLGLIEIYILWAFITATIWSFWKIEKKAAYLLLPYIAWVTFASMLNLFIWLLN